MGVDLMGQVQWDDMRKVKNVGGRKFFGDYKYVFMYFIGNIGERKGELTNG